MMNRFGLAAVFVFIFCLAPLANAQCLNFPKVRVRLIPTRSRRFEKCGCLPIERDYRLAQRINRGEFDEEAECEMLLHNIRLADRLGKTEEANKLRKRHRDLEIHRSGMSEVETM